jgi:hypothetical protein
MHCNIILFPIIPCRAQTLIGSRSVLIRVGNAFLVMHARRRVACTLRALRSQGAMLNWLPLYGADVHGTRDAPTLQSRDRHNFAGPCCILQKATLLRMTSLCSRFDKLAHIARCNALQTYTHCFSKAPTPSLPSPSRLSAVQNANLSRPEH